MDATVDGGAPLLVAWASQTGFAQVLAERSATMLREAGLPVLALPLDAVDAPLLERTRRALFVASTTGEGDPPDHALAFLRRTLPQTPALDRLEYALLALGDREYQDYCGFGRQLDEWLRARGARALFDRVEVDNADEATLRHWQYEVGRIGGLTDLPDWSPPAYDPWRLQARTQVNPGSPGAPVFDLALVPAEGSPLPPWHAGDIAEIGPRNPPERVQALLSALQLPVDASVDTAHGREPLPQALARLQLPAPEAVRGLPAQQLVDGLSPLPHREYSIASIPSEGHVRLLVRRLSRPDGSAGLGSGWLCDRSAPGGAIDLRLRRNPGFHPAAAGRPLLLIGNGTGIAGLRAHLQARIAAGARGNWLLFGERSPDHDRPYGEEIRQWRAQGWLERLDLAFSRAADKPEYVQHRLQAAADTLVDWVDRGASILVCGSASGMAPAVDAVLATVLGEARRDALRIEGRYRRDVY
jgi:sulfite reductase (NADPH) flavoprotein alpha-component